MQAVSRNIIAAVLHYFAGGAASTLEAGAEGASTAMETTITYTNGDTYTGQVDTDGKKDGKGILRKANGDVYDGQFRGGMRHGEGKYTRAGGDVYDGPWKNNLMHGKGILKLKDGNDYGGEFWNNKLHGKNKLKHLNITIYDFMWKGQLHTRILLVHPLDVLLVLGILMAGLWTFDGGVLLKRLIEVIWHLLNLLFVLKGFWTLYCDIVKRLW